MEVVCEYDNSVVQKFCNSGRHLGLGGEGYSLRFSWSDRNRNQMGINCTIFSSVKRTYISSEVSINLDIQIIIFYHDRLLLLIHHAISQSKLNHYSQYPRLFQLHTINKKNNKTIPIAIQSKKTNHIQSIHHQSTHPTTMTTRQIQLCKQSGSLGLSLAQSTPSPINANLNKDDIIQINPSFANTALDLTSKLGYQGKLLLFNLFL